ncbi:MAG: type II toxin-antitoxin system HicA family toxin [Bacteroidetes bacterium]|nr:type II toxin-antitoxin system HicA family toxin [Bacteroidota bacterium]
MKLPRNVDSQQLIKALQKYNYQATRQTGSHIRLTTQQNGQHHITIPNHDPLRIGTLNTILTEVAQHLGISKQEVAERLF